MTEPSEEAAEFMKWLSGPNGGGSHERPWLVVEWAQSLGSDEGRLFWEVVVEEWSGFDLIPHDEFEDLFTQFEPDRPQYELPATMTVYRGQDAAAPKGLSWTVDRKVAERFAQGHRGLRNPNPVVLQTEVNAGQVAFICNDRDESEVVLRKVPT